MGRKEKYLRSARLPERIEPPQAFANPVPTGESLAHHVLQRSTCLRPVILRRVGFALRARQTCSIPSRFIKYCFSLFSI
jgi:hypothetical protein